MPGSRLRGSGLVWSQVRVGVLILLGLAIAAYGVFRVGDLLNIFTGRYELVALFPTAAGLVEGSAVTVAGLRVGQVEEVALIPLQRQFAGNHVSVRISVSQDVREQIRADSRAQLRTQGLLGDRYIDVEPGSPGAPVLQPGDTIPSVPPLQVEDLLATASVVLDEAGIVMSSMRRITTSIERGEGTLGRLLTDDALYIQLSSAAAQLEQSLRAVMEADGTLGRLIWDPTLYEHLLAAVARMDTIGGKVLHGEGTFGRLLSDDSLYRSLLGVVSRADTAVAGLTGMLGRVGAADGTLGRLLTDPALYDQLLKAVVDLQILLNDIRANPKRYRPEIRIF